VAALVEKVAADSFSLVLVNTDPLETREVLVQAGTFGEHAFTEATLESASGEEQRYAIDGKYFQVRLGPWAQARLRVGIRRYADLPSYEFPPFGEG
jgi:hypothetical protein